MQAAAGLYAPKPPLQRAADGDSSSGGGARLACHVSTCARGSRTCDGRLERLTPVLRAVRRSGAPPWGNEKEGLREALKPTPPFRNCVFDAELWRWCALRKGAASRGIS